MEKITKKARCQAPNCNAELIGGVRQQDDHEREFWLHVYGVDELRGGLHTAFPLAESVEEI